MIVVLLTTMEVMKVSADFDITSVVDAELGVQLSNGVEGSEAPEDDLLNDLDSYMDDIKERLTVSRMVSDAVVRGVVKAVEYEAAERIAAKELEVVAMKGALQSCSANTNKNEVSGLQVFLQEHGVIRESFISLGRAAEEQLKTLEKQIRGVKECNSIRKISPGPESLPFGGISHAKNAPQRWIDIDKMLQALKTTVEATHNQLDRMIYIPGALLSQWQQERELQGEVEAMVIGNSIQSLQEEFKEKLQDHNAKFCCERGRMSFGEMFNDISSIHQELSIISKSLFSSEVGHQTTHGYPSTEERTKSAKRIDNLHHKVLKNEKQDSKISLPENSDSLQLMHMSKEDMYRYFKTEMTKLKRNHESEVLRITEENFGLKRELFKRESSLPSKKDKEFEVLRKKIPEIILRLEQILVENEKLLSCHSNAESHGRLEALFLENCQLKDVVENKKKEVKCLSSSISDAEEKISQQTLAEANMLKMTGNLTDAHIETLVREDVYECILKEVIGHSNTEAEQFNLETSIMQKIYQSIFREAVQSAYVPIECRNLELAMESAIIHELCTIIFREAFRDAVTEFDSLKEVYTREVGLRASLESKTLEAERAQGLVYEEKEKLEEEMLLMAAKVLDKDKLAQESLVASEKLRKQFQQVSQDLHSFQEQLKEQKILVVNRCKEIDLMKCDYNEALRRIDLYEKEIRELNEKLKEHDLESRTNLKSIILIVNGLLNKGAAFECKVTESLKWTNIRLQNSASHLQSLNQKANTLRRTGALYKKRLERRCLDLQKAEAEVDLLGDEVETFSSLLEKIYIALDHYSPVLQHYPGIMEILKLIRRELSVGSAKHV